MPGTKIHSLRRRGAMRSGRLGRRLFHKLAKVGFELIWLSYIPSQSAVTCSASSATVNHTIPSGRRALAMCGGNVFWSNEVGRFIASGRQTGGWIATVKSASFWRALIHSSDSDLSLESHAVAMD